MVWTVLAAAKPMQVNPTLADGNHWPGPGSLPSQSFLLSYNPRAAPQPFPRQVLLFRPTPSPRIPHRPIIELCIPSSLDPTLAPPGCHVISLFTQYTPYTLAGGKAWDELERNTYADRGKEG